MKWLFNWDMWSAVGQVIGAIGTVVAVWVAIKTASDSQRLSLKSIKIAEETLNRQLQIIEDERTPSVELVEDMEEDFHFKVIATNVKALPITIVECYIEVEFMIGGESGVPCISLFSSLNISQPLPYTLNLGDQLIVSVNKFKLRKFVLNKQIGLLEKVVFVFIDSRKNRHELVIKGAVNYEKNDIRISEFEPYGINEGMDIKYDPRVDNVVVILIKNSKYPLLVNIPAGIDLTKIDAKNEKKQEEISKETSAKSDISTSEPAVTIYGIKDGVKSEDLDKQIEEVFRKELEQLKENR
jgi:hypothetical protein